MINQVYIGVGSNLGDSKKILHQVIKTIKLHFHQVQVAPIYQSTPLGSNSDGNDYLNTVIGFQTHLSAFDVLEYLFQLEKDYGRERPYPNAPRTLDLDLLLYNQDKMNTPKLTIPHPRMHERAFVLYPLHDIAPNLVLPQGSWDNLLSQCQNQQIHLLKNTLK